MAGAVQHDYHLVKPSPWPLVGATGALALLAGAAAWMHDVAAGPYLFYAGLAVVLITMISWWMDVVKESHQGDHTRVVQIGLRYGMILFIASEVMFFVAWFWAYFDASLFPKEAVGGVWPPNGIEVLDPFHLPLMNTIILLLSGSTVTWAHHALIHDDRAGLKQGLWLTILLGMSFTSIQAYEYNHASFAFAGNIYGSTFYMATGFHGFHVLVGTVFLTVCLIRAYLGHFRPNQHFGFEAAAWYWHFVDVVWLFLFTFIYVLGSGNAPVH